MDPSFESGDINRTKSFSPRTANDKNDPKDDHENNESLENGAHGAQEKTLNTENITPKTIEDHETKLKDRIGQCRSIIESLKLELNEEKAKHEKAKLEKDTKSQPVPCMTQPMDDLSNYKSRYYNVSTSNDIWGDFAMSTDMYSTCVDGKLNCDQSLIEYEKQLEKYQTTLNMAQLEKKNAIRKQMLTKAYKLKLMELENQCNIELLRVKQCLQCLEPLQMIASKWKMGSDDGSYDLDKFELMPCYPEISSTSEAVKDALTEAACTDVKDVSTSD